MSMDRDEMVEEWIEGISVPSIEDMRDRPKSLTLLEILAFYKRQRDKLRREGAGIVSGPKMMLLEFTEKAYGRMFDMIEPRMRERRKEMMELQALVEQKRESAKSMGLPEDGVPYPYNNLYEMLVHDPDNKQGKGTVAGPDN